MVFIDLAALFAAENTVIRDEDRVLALQALQAQMRNENRVLTLDEIYLLMANLRHADYRIREECLLTLSDCSRTTGRIAALTLLLDEEDFIRDRALEELEFAGGEQDWYAVERVLATEPEWTVRASAVSCLAGIAEGRAKPAITAALRDENPHVRRYAAIALARVGSVADVDALLQAEREETEKESKIGIYSALYRLGRAEYLHKMLDCVLVPFPSSDLQILVLNTLNNFTFPGDREAIRSYLRTLDLQTAHPEVRELANRLWKWLDEPPK